ncbi:hypothetical protein FQZ97_865660 [compost metagenome]
MDSGRTLTAVLHWAPAVPSDIHPFVMHQHAFGAQTCPLFRPGNAPRRQTQASARGNDAMPGQCRTFGQLTEGASHPACGAAKTGQFRQLAIADHLAFRDLRERRIQRFTARSLTCRREGRRCMLGGLFPSFSLSTDHAATHPAAICALGLGHAAVGGHGLAE